MEALKWAEVLLPTATALGVAWMGITAAARERRLKAIESEIDKLRRRSHDTVADVQRLPVSLEPHFVERREWEQAQKAGDAIHQDHAKRISDLERVR